LALASAKRKLFLNVGVGGAIGGVSPQKYLLSNDERAELFYGFRIQELREKGEGRATGEVDG
jgi:hypothetical protein